MFLSHISSFAASARSRPVPRTSRPAKGAGACACACVCAAALLALGGCATEPASGYGPSFLRPSSSAAQQAAAATATAGPGAAAAVDTAANYQALIRQMQGKGLWYASLAHVDALELRWGASDDSRLLRADALLQTEQTDAAEPVYHALLASPMAPAAYRGLARIAAARGMPHETVRMFEQARLRTPTDAALLGDLGYALLQAGQIGRARVPLMQAAQLQADAPDAAPRIFSNLAVYLLLAGKPDEARALADRRGMAPAVWQAVVQQARVLGRPVADGRDAADGVPDASAAVADAPQPAPATAAPVAAAIPPQEDSAPPLPPPSRGAGR